MEFSFTQEQEMVRETAATFLAEKATSKAVRRVMATESGYDPALWQQVSEELCWPAMHLPEQFGGLGLGYVELMATMEQMGRFLFCSPFLASICMAANAVLLAGNDSQKQTYLPQLAAGTTATLAFTGNSGRWDAQGIDATCTQAADGYHLCGSYRFVIDGHTAGFLLLAARAPGTAGEAGVSLFIVRADTPGITRQLLPTLDQTRRQAQLTLDNVWVSADALLGVPGQGWPVLSHVIDLATVALAAEQLGGMQQVLDMTVAYLQEREQFGRKIASFQALKHKAADMMVKAEAARSAVYYAACVADDALLNSKQFDALREAASMAKAYCSEGYFFNAGTGIQLHGGVGITADYDIQLYFKRAKSSETLFGNASYHRERLAELLLDAG
ncbi:MAG: acyl-CoA dehydrogenase family protein [Pseudomonadota bacterium]